MARDSTPEPRVSRNSPAKPKAKGSKTKPEPATGPAPVPCKISPVPGSPGVFQVQANDKPVNIQLCENRKHDPAKSTWFYTDSVTVFLHNTTTVVTGQPTSLTKTTFTLKGLPSGEYDIGVTVQHIPNARGYVYEECDKPQVELCDIDTSIAPNSRFTLVVIK
jgi:hypothetical protein